MRNCFKLELLEGSKMGYCMNVLFLNFVIIESSDVMFFSVSNIKKDPDSFEDDSSRVQILLQSAIQQYPKRHHRVT